MEGVKLTKGINNVMRSQNAVSLAEIFIHYVIASTFLILCYSSGQFCLGKTSSKIIDLLLCYRNQTEAVEHFCGIAKQSKIDLCNGNIT